VAGLPLQGEHRRRPRVLGRVLDIIDTDGLAKSRARDEGAIVLLHHQRRPAVVVSGFPDDAARFWLTQSYVLRLVTLANVPPC
jgi:hypothetical protein